MGWMGRERAQDKLTSRSGFWCVEYSVQSHWVSKIKKDFSSEGRARAYEGRILRQAGRPGHLDTKVGRH